MEITELEKHLIERVQCLIRFLRNHRYDPSEYYGDLDYLKEIPNPCNEPIAILEEFIHIITNFGNYFIKLKYANLC